MQNYLSIDIGGTNVKYAKMNNAGSIIKQFKIKTLHEKEAFLRNIDKIVTEYINQGIKGLAFCAPGKIAKSTIHFGGSLPFLDGKASVLAENWLGNLRGKKNCAAITLGTGVGGGIIINGRLLSGVHFQAGELSALLADTNNPGFDGLMGSTASAVNMIKKINHKLNNTDETDGLAAFKAINVHDPRIMPTFEEFCKNVAALIIDTQAVLDLDTYVIGGGISAQPIVVKAINNAYDQLLNAVPLIKTMFTKPQILEAKFRIVLICMVLYIIYSSM